jgi:uncharacterized protein (DUF2461 family)
LKVEESFYVLLLPNGKFVGPRVMDPGDNLYRQIRRDQESFMKAQHYTSERNARLAKRYFKGSEVKEVKGVFQINEG